MGLPNLTPEEEYLLKKFALLKKKAKLQTDLWRKRKCLKEKMDSIVKGMKRMHTPNINDLKVTALKIISKSRWSLSAYRMPVKLMKRDRISQGEQEKKKALQKSKEKTETPVVIKPGAKRDVPAEVSHAPEDAKKIAKKLIASGEVKIKKDPVHREFKRAKGGERRQKPDFLQQPSSSRNEQQSQAAAMKNLYDSFVPSAATQNRRFSEGQDHRRSWAEEPRKGNTIFVKGIGLTEKILQESFTKFGKVQRVNFEKDRSQGLVTFESCDAAENAIEEMNGMMVSGVIIKVVLSRRQTNMADSHFRNRPGLGSRDSRGNSSGLQSREARELIAYDDI